jgi:glycosyltransferase involved in cell wall biosynthesis
MSVKVINILNHIPDQIIKDYQDPNDFVQRFTETEFIKLDKFPFWVGFLKVDFHHRWGKYIKDASIELEIDCWRPYGSQIKQIYKKEVDGIIHKVFPSKEYKIKKVGSFTYSPQMLQELKTEIKKNNKVIIHFYGAHYLLSYYLIIKLRKTRVPIIVQQLGGWFYCFDSKKIPNPFTWIKYSIEKHALRYVSKYLTASRTEFSFLGQKFKNSDYEFFLNGIDLNKFKRINSKKDAKVKLGLTEGQQMILYVGRLNYTKNVDLLIKAYTNLKALKPEIKLFLVGGYKTDIFYNEAVSCGAKVIERSDASISIYYEAADVYVMPVSNYHVKEFGGFGIAPMEALAFDVPVISQNIKHFNGPISDIDSIGILLNDFNQLENAIFEVLNNSTAYSNGRQFLEKYFDIQKQTQKIIKIYNSIHFTE